jgi:hypothetical protein
VVLDALAAIEAALVATGLLVEQAPQGQARAF